MLEDTPVYEQATAGAAARPSRFTGTPLTLVIIGVNVLVYLAMVLSGVSPVSPTPRQVIPWGADFGPLTFDGQWWRVVTACFIHFGIIHLAFNMYILFQIGLFVELVFGRARFLLIYFVAGIGGSLVSLYVHPVTTGAGASGAIFGLYGALLGFLLIERDALPVAEAKATGKSAAIFLGYNLIYGIANGTTDLSAHIGGFVTGFVVSCVLLLKREQGVSRRLSAAKIMLVVIAAIAISVAGLAAVPQYAKGNDAWYRALLTGNSVPDANDGKVIYTGLATRAEAVALASEIDAIGLSHNKNLVVWLSKTAQETTLSIPMAREESDYVRLNPAISISPDGTPATPGGEVLPWNDHKIIANFYLMGMALAPAVGGPPIQVQLMTPSGLVKRTIPIDGH